MLLLLLLPLLLALLAAALLLAARPGRGAAGLIGAALALALAGYSWQGHPELPGSPARGRALQESGSGVLFARERHVWLDEVGPDGQALDAADGLIAHGDAAYAIGILRAGLARSPRDMTLWVALGNALASYADGAVTPAVRYAFDRAVALAPHHPAPRYFLGLAYAQSGDLDAAERTWRDLLRETPADAPWKPLVGRKLALIARLRAMAM